jgi:REP element-mobilizing transposase RayT
MDFSAPSRYRGRHLALGQDAVYHVVSRTAFRRYAFEDTEKRQFLRLLRKQAGFCGIEVLAYCVMSNHFHLMIKVPEPGPISDVELLRRYRLLYGGKHCPPSSPAPTVLEALLRKNDREGQLLRNRILSRMHNLAVFMRELKQRFGIWYNHRHTNRGTLWSERFRSTIVEATPEALSTVAAYIDLNPVRARIVDDPANYHFSSFGEASGGHRRARRGYESIFCMKKGWEQLLPSYNLILYGKGETAKGSTVKDLGRIDPEKAARVLAAGGQVSVAEALRMRIRYFSAGTALGSQEFLNTLSSKWNAQFGTDRTNNAHPMRGAAWGDLRSYRNLRKDPLMPPLLPD